MSMSLAKNSRARRAAAVACVAVVAAGLVGGVSSASAAEPVGPADDIVTAFDSVVMGGVVGLDTKTGRSTTIEPVNGIANVVDAVTGKVLGPSSLRLNVSDAGGEPIGNYKCVHNGSRKDLTIFHPERRRMTGRAGIVDFTYNPYMRRNARQLDTGRTTQSRSVPPAVATWARGGGSSRSVPA